MEQAHIINELARNRMVFEALLNGTEINAVLWKPAPDKWCLLEVVCHLYDEEREDFRARVKHCLENPTFPLPAIDPAGWVERRKYIGQDFDEKLSSFLNEREISIEWLRSLENPNWENAHDHPTQGRMSAQLFLANWLAHDYIHIRQLNRLKYEFLDGTTQDYLKYAGDW